MKGVKSLSYHNVTGNGKREGCENRKKRKDGNRVKEKLSEDSPTFPVTSPRTGTIYLKLTYILSHNKGGFVMWKDIIGYEGLYLINEYGDIYSQISNKLLAPYISNKGYKIIDLVKDGVRKKYSVHKLVAIHFVPNPYNLPIVLHKDNDKLNTYYENLEWGTYSDNNRQAIQDGLNFVPIPDNRKYYEIYDDNTSVVCCGINEVIKEIGFGNDSYVRNLLFRHQKIKEGKYKGCSIRKKDIIRPIRFTNFR